MSLSAERAGLARPAGGDGVTPAGDQQEDAKAYGDDAGQGRPRRGPMAASVRCAVWAICPATVVELDAGVEVVVARGSVVGKAAHWCPAVGVDVHVS